MGHRALWEDAFCSGRNQDLSSKLCLSFIILLSLFVLTTLYLFQRTFKMRHILKWELLKWVCWNMDGEELVEISWLKLKTGKNSNSLSEFSEKLEENRL